MGLFDGLKKMVGVVDQGEALVLDNDKVTKEIARPITVGFNKAFSKANME